MKNNLFLAQTPYNLLLSAGLAATKHANEHNEVILLSSFHGEQYLLDGFKRAAPDLFANIHLVPYSWLGDNGEHRKKTRLAALNAIKPLVDAKQWDCVYACSTQLPFNHALWRSARGRQKPRRILIEEGFSCYLNEHGKLTSRLEIPLKKLQYGGGWVEPFRLGTHPAIDEAWLHFPKLANSWVSGLPCKELPVSILVNDTLHRWAEELLESQPWHRSSTKPLAVIVIEKLPFLSEPEQYKKHYRSLILQLQRQGLEIALKYHPRDKSGEYLGEFDGCILLPPGLPVELYLAHEHSRLRCVIGEFTTALATARIVAPDARVISLQSSGRRKPELETIYASIGVPIANTADEASAKLDNLNVKAETQPGN